MRFSLVALLLLAAGCSSSTSPSAFNGTWNCTTTETLTYMKPVTGMYPYTTHETVILSLDDGQPFTISNGAEAGKVCTLTYDTAGESATLASGQTCDLDFTQNGVTYAVTVQYESGAATVSPQGSGSGGTISGTSSFKFTGTGSTAKVSVNITGTGTGTTSCTGG